MAPILTILKKVGMILSDDHFVGTSGRHMGTYLNKDALFPYPEEVSKVGKLFAQKYADKNIDVVVGPAMGGIILSQWAAYHLSKKTKRVVHGVYTEKTPENGQEFKRGYDKFVKGKRVLIIEDLTTTGGSVLKVINAVKQAGGNIIEACVMVNRDEKLVNSETMGVPFASLGVYPVQSYLEADCPLCKRGKPINTTVGHGKKYLQSKGTI